MEVKCNNLFQFDVQLVVLRTQQTCTAVVDLVLLYIKTESIDEDRSR